MRQLRKNMIPLKYALYLGETTVYEIDGDGNVIYYTDSDGNSYPLDTGQKELAYYDVVPFLCSLSMSGGEAEAVEYGLSTADYEAKLSYPKDSFSIEEGSYIWSDSEVEYRYNGKEVWVEVDGEMVTTKLPDPISADYMVLKLIESKNEVVAILKAVNK